MCHFIFGPLSKFHRAESSAQTHEGCARCLVSLLPHIECERIAGYTALRTDSEAAG